MNNLYERIQESYNEVTRLTTLYGGTTADSKKLKGALTSELIRAELISYFKENNLNLTVANVNSYIFGSKNEYDLMIVNANASPYMGFIYSPNDVVSIIEVKARGLYNLNTDLNNIIDAANRAYVLNNSITFGYITITENVPKNTIYRGKATINQWEITKHELSENICCENAIYAVTLYSGNENNLIDEGNNTEFSDFINQLIKNVPH